MRGASWCGRPCGVAAAFELGSGAGGRRGLRRDQLGDRVRIVGVGRLGFDVLLFDRLGDQVRLRLLGCGLWGGGRLRPLRRRGEVGQFRRRGRLRFRARRGFGLWRRRRLRFLRRLRRVGGAQFGRRLWRRGQRWLGSRRGRRLRRRLGGLLAVHDLVELRVRNRLDRNRFLAVIEFRRRREPEDQEQQEGAMKRARDRPARI